MLISSLFFFSFSQNVADSFRRVCLDCPREVGATAEYAAILGQFPAILSLPR